jgi:hypothetical protein
MMVTVPGSYVTQPVFFGKALYTLAVKLSDVTVWRHTWRKNWVNCAVLTGNSEGLRTVLSSRLSRGELRSSLRESQSFLNLPADTTMASSQGTQPSKMNKWEAALAFIEAHSSLPELWDTENKHYSNRVKKAAAYDTRTRRHTELTKKTWQPWWETCALPENIQFSFSCSIFLHSQTAQFNLERMWPLTHRVRTSGFSLPVALCYLENFRKYFPNFHTSIREKKKSCSELLTCSETLLYNKDFPLKSLLSSRDFTFLPRCKRDLRSSGMLRSVDR